MPRAAAIFTMTGCRLRGSGSIAERTQELRRIHARLFPTRPKTAPPPQGKPDAAFRPDDELIARARQAKDGGKFARLWDGQWEGEYASQSEADLALCGTLAFWTGRDEGRMDALFRRSGLMREKWERQDYRDVTIAKAIAQTPRTWTPRGPDHRPWTVEVNPDRATPSIELLNACPMFGGRLQFATVKRRGPMIIATFRDGGEGIWHSTVDLMSFARSQAIIAEATQVVIPTPQRRSIKADWEPAAQWILRLAGKDETNSTDSLREEFRQIIPGVWKRADCPHVEDDAAFFEVLQECEDHRRDPTAQRPPRRCVWHDNNDTYVHQPALIEWLSTPAGHKQTLGLDRGPKRASIAGFRPGADSSVARFDHRKGPPLARPPGSIGRRRNINRFASENYKGHQPYANCISVPAVPAGLTKCCSSL
jgi:hypothetical protein